MAASAETGRDPVAIVGMALRVPGADNCDELWTMVAGGRDAIGRIPEQRFDIDEWFDPEPGRSGRIATRSGGFLKDIDAFDAAFFGLSPREAIRLDPQHRLILVTVWEAVEDAGLTLDQLAGSRTGVYTASLGSDYWDMVRAAGMHDMHAAIGAGSWGLPSARISHLLDLRGPSMGLEATCSTALLAVHLACRDLRSGDTEQAIVSGAHLLLSPDLYLSLSEAAILSPTGQRRFGDVGADGYVRSEGAVSIVLKPLSAAVRDGDLVHAVIRGSGVSNNGRSGDSLISPGLDGQRETLRAAYRDAGIRPSDVDYIEAHGAGTPRGDDVELTALSDVLGPGRSPDSPCLVGTVKSNVGHTEVVSGLVGLVKAALALRHRTIPATLGVKDPRDIVTAPGSPLAVASTGRPWPITGRPATAGVSAFGLSATNVHVVLSETPPSRDPDRDEQGEPTVVLPLSGRGPQVLPELASRYAGLLEQGKGRLSDIAYSAGVRRSHHDHRVAVVGSDRAELVAALRAIASPGARPATSRPAATAPQVVFVFSGQGSQWAGMGSALLRQDDVFRARLLECEEAIQREAGWSPIAKMTAGEPLTGEDQVQPAIWAVQTALAARWQAWGVVPDLVVGHSMGEVAAATVAGALSVADAAAVICRRSTLVSRLAAPGAMLAVQLGELDARAAIGQDTDRVSVGVINSAHSTVLTGDPEAIERVEDRLNGRGVFHRRVRVRYASHAPQIEPVGTDLIAGLSDLSPRPSRIPLYSTALDRLLGDDDRLDAEYWMTNLRQPVRFAAAIQAALATGRPTVFIELSPHPLLLSAIEDGAAYAGVAALAVGSLMRDEPEALALRRSLAAAYAAGIDLDWSAVHPHGRPVRLPTYPWHNQRYWAGPHPGASPQPEAAAAPEQDPPEDELYMSDSEAEPVLQTILRSASEIAAGRTAVLRDVRLPATAGRRAAALRSVIDRDQDGWRFHVYAGDSARPGTTAWSTAGSGRLRFDARPAAVAGSSLAMVRRWCTSPIVAGGTADFHELMRRDGEAFGVLNRIGAAELPELLSHAAAALAAAAPGGRLRSGPGATAFAELSARPDLNAAHWVHARLKNIRPGITACGDVWVLDRDDRVIIEVRDLEVGGAGTAPVPATPAPPANPQRQDLRERLAIEIANLLGVAPQALDRDRPLPLLGMDSLLAAKLRAALSRELGVEVPLRELLTPRTVEELAAALQR